MFYKSDYLWRDLKPLQDLTVSWNQHCTRDSCLDVGLNKDFDARRAVGMESSEGIQDAFV